MIRLFDDIQKIVDTGRRKEVSVPASKSLIITNSTNDIAYIYHRDSSKIGYPLKVDESLEINGILEEAIFDVELLATQIEKHQGLFLISQHEDRDLQALKEYNTVVIKNA